MIDCIPSAGRAIQMQSGSIGSTLKNINIRLTGAYPGGGAVGILFQDVMQLIEGVTCKDSGAGFTAANCMSFTGGAPLTIVGCTPSPYSASATINPGTVASASFYQTTVTVTGAALGDFVTVSPGVNMLTLSVSAYVISANTVQVVIYNNTGAGVTPGSSTWKVIVDKRA
jgi:hypothetical protein